MNTEARSRRPLMRLLNSEGTERYGSTKEIGKNTEGDNHTPRYGNVMH